MTEEPPLTASPALARELSAVPQRHMRQAGAGVALGRAKTSRHRFQGLGLVCLCVCVRRWRRLPAAGGAGAPYTSAACVRRVEDTAQRARQALQLLVLSLLLGPPRRWVSLAHWGRCEPNGSVLCVEMQPVTGSCAQRAGGREAVHSLLRALGERPLPPAWQLACQQETQLQRCGTAQATAGHHRQHAHEGPLNNAALHRQCSSACGDGGNSLAVQHHVSPPANRRRGPVHLPRRRACVERKLFNAPCSPSTDR